MLSVGGDVSLWLSQYPLRFIDMTASDIDEHDQLASKQTIA